MTSLTSPLKVLFALLVLTFALYYPGLYGEFILDDQSNIVDDNAIKISSITYDTLAETANSGVAGPLKRPVAVLSFALNYYFSGLDPFYFKLVNVLLHLLTGICIYILSVFLASRLLDFDFKKKNRTNISPQSIALLCTALWLLHPLNISNVLYVVQRMNGLAAFFTFLSLIYYYLFRERLFLSQKSWAAYLLMYLFMASLAILSKENALLITTFALLIEIIVFKFKSQNNQQKWILYGLHTFFFVLPLTLYILFYFDTQTLQNSYLHRSFSLSERVFSELNILIFYLKQILTPNILEQSIFHDGWPITKNLFDSIKTILSLIIILTLLLSSLFLYKRKPILSFGILWFFIGHSLESTIFPLELIFEHRNYVPMFGLLFIMAFYIQYFLSSEKRVLSLFVLSIYLIFLASSTFLRAIEWGDSVTHITSEQQRHPESYRANLQLGNLYHKAAVFNQNSNDHQYFIDKSLKYYQIAIPLNKRYTVAYLGSILLYAELKKEIPVSLFNEYNQSLNSNPIHISTALSFLKLNNCFIKPDCRISTAQVETLYSSILNNKHISKSNKAIVFAYYGDYFQFNNNLDNAFKFMQLAHKNSPNDRQYKIRLINILILMKRFDQAKTIINTIEKIYITEDILDIKNALNEIQ